MTMPNPLPSPTTTPTVAPVTPTAPIKPAPAPVTPTPAPVPPGTEPPTTKGSDTHPQLILYALMVYSFYFAAKHTAADLKDPKSPTAHGLFKYLKLNYNINMPAKNMKDTEEESKNAENDITLARSVGGRDADAIRNTFPELFMDEPEEPVKDTEETSDMDDETPV